MEEADFRRRLELFPVVRSPDYHVDLDPSRKSTSARSSAPNVEAKDWHDAWEEEREQARAENGATDLQVKVGVEIPVKMEKFVQNKCPFWEKLKSAAEKKMDAAEAKRFCKAFERVHRKLVHEELSLDAVHGILSTSSKQ